MAKETMLKRGSAHRMKSSITSPKQAQRLFKAISDLQSYKLDELEKTGKVKKIKVQDNDNVYVFRVGLNERIVFSPVDDTNVIHDIIDVNNDHSIRSLLTFRKKN